MCIDIIDIWFVVVNGQISSKFDMLSASDRYIFSFLDDNFSKYQWIFTKLGMCIVIVEICFGIAHRQFSSVFDRVSVPYPIFISGQLLYQISMNFHQT